MKILISGAASMIGAALANEFTAQEHDVVAVVRPNSAKKQKLKNSTHLSVIECGMKDYALLPDLVNSTIDAAFSVAWNGTRGSERNNMNLQEENCEYSVDFLHSAVDLGCKKFITAGSQAEYGSTHGTEKVNEKTEPHPDSAYGKNKLRFYEYAQEYCQKKKCTLIEPRFFSIYGPDDYPGSMIISTLRKMLNNETCDLTACTQLWDFLFIDDVVTGLTTLIKSTTAQGIYNFGYGESAILKTYIEIMYQLTKSSSRLNFGVVPYSETGPVNLNPSVEKLKSTGWVPKVSFPEGIKGILNFYSYHKSFLI